MRSLFAPLTTPQRSSVLSGNREEASLVSSHRTIKTRTARAAIATVAAAACAFSLAHAPQASAQSSLPEVPAVQLPQVPTPQPILDQLGRPNEQILQQMENVSNDPQTPDNVKALLKKAVAFFRGTGESGFEVPQNGPIITQFGWPTAAQQCIGGKTGSVGMATMVPGPAKLPLPGVPAGHVSFVFTGLGTGPVESKQQTAMNVHWVNINTLKYGTTQLGYHGINPDGPSTINGTADTGAGTVVALLEGGVTTKESSGATNCTYFPTAGVAQVK